jgi:hypothetical protein
MARTIERTDATDAAWQAWTAEHADLFANSLTAQKVLLEAAVRFVAAIEHHPVVSRMGAFFLLHAHLGLTPAQVGAAVGRTDRAMRTVQALSALDFLDSIWRELGRHRTPKLLPEHAGPVAKYLVEHPGCTVAQILAFLHEELHIDLDRKALRRFSQTYNLGVFRAPTDHEDEDGERPFSWDAPTSGEPSSCSPSPSG